MNLQKTKYRKIIEGEESSKAMLQEYWIRQMKWRKKIDGEGKRKIKSRGK